MTMRQLQNRLVRLIRLQDEISQELFARGLDADWTMMEESQAKAGMVCLALLDEKTINEDLNEISDVVRETIDGFEVDRGREAYAKAIVSKLKKGKRIGGTGAYSLIQLAPDSEVV
ncbi:hypothetical protein [Terracidiphilus gabretensis]|uniref:hypothetical protein n=1 Tax=Terracidiphilus gabretensis TaxID=1577687 RepID=UPI00071BB0A0|nr:hypothetical protein [Terracidiphilus gabretensis]